MLNYDSLENFIKSNWALIQHHKYALSDIENMIAWERQVYSTLTLNYVREENERIKLERQQRK